MWHFAVLQIFQTDHAGKWSLELQSNNPYLQPPFLRDGKPLLEWSGTNSVTHKSLHDKEVTGPKTTQETCSCQRTSSEGTSGVLLVAVNLTAQLLIPPIRGSREEMRRTGKLRGQQRARFHTFAFAFTHGECPRLHRLNFPRAEKRRVLPFPLVPPCCVKTCDKAGVTRASGPSQSSTSRTTGSGTRSPAGCLQRKNYITQNAVHCTCAAGPGPMTTQDRNTSCESLRRAGLSAAWW